MASKSCDRIFFNMLVEVQKNNPNKNKDVVAEKKKHFQDKLNRAHYELRMKKFSKAKECYWRIIEFLNADPYPDELNISADVIYSVKCCFCYSCLMDVQDDTEYNKICSEVVKELSQKHRHKLFPKFLQLLLFFHQTRWAMALKSNGTDKTDKESIDRQFLSTAVTQQCGNAVLSRNSTVFTKTEVYEDFFTFWRNLTSSYFVEPQNIGYQFLIKEIIIKLLDLYAPFLESSFCEDKIPVWVSVKNGLSIFNTEENGLVPYDNGIGKKIQKCGINCKDDKINLEKFLVKLIETLTKIYNTDHVKSFLHFLNIVTQGDLKIMDNSVKENFNLVNAQTQTDRLQTESHSIQTDTTRLKNVNATTQTQKDGSKSRYTQTTNVESKSVEVQVSFDVPIIDTMFDIKNKLLATQEKKDNSILKLNRKLCEVNEKLNKEFMKRKSLEEELNKKNAKLQDELNKLRGQLEENKKQHEQEKEKQLFELFGEKYNSQKNVYKILEKKSSFMVSYLKDLLQYVTPNSIPNKIAVQVNIDAWEADQTRIKNGLDQLNAFYLKVSQDVFTSQTCNNVTWPEPPKFPKDEDNIVFKSFKEAIINIVEVEESMNKRYNTTATTAQTPIQPYSPRVQNNPYAIPPQYPFQNSTYFVRPRFVYPTLQQPMPMAASNATLPMQCEMFNRNRMPQDTAGYYHMAHNPQTYMAPMNTQFMPTDNLRTSDNGSVPLSIPSTIWVGASTSGAQAPGASGSQTAGASGLKDASKKVDRKYQEKEKIIFEHVLENCPNSSEEDVTLALLQVVSNNKGSLAKLPKDKIVQEVKMVLGMKKQSAWVTPKSPHIDWENDNAEPTCSICFEEFSLKETYTLRCKHAYHKECIKKWLKTSSVCPICRVHSVIDDEFPPLH